MEKKNISGIIAVITTHLLFVLFWVMVIESYRVKNITMIDGDKHPRWRSNFKRTEKSVCYHTCWIWKAVMLSMLSYLAMVENKCLGMYVGQIYTCSIEFWTHLEMCTKFI